MRWRKQTPRWRRRPQQQQEQLHDAYVVTRTTTAEADVGVLTQQPAQLRVQLADAIAHAGATDEVAKLEAQAAYNEAPVQQLNQLNQLFNARQDTNEDARLTANLLAALLLAHADVKQWITRALDAQKTLKTTVSFLKAAMETARGAEGSATRAVGALQAQLSTITLALEE